MIADVGLGLVREGAIADAVDAIAEVIGRRISTATLAKDTELRAALVALAEKNAPEFNRKNPNAPGVYYQSFAGVSSRFGIGDNDDDDACDGKLSGKPDIMDVRLKAASLLVGRGFGFQKGFRPNDGFVTVQSAKWGRFRGCIRADHLDEVGQPKHDRPNKTGFDHRKFYRSIAFGLAARRL